jgi:hypothetical protein
MTEEIPERGDRRSARSTILSAIDDHDDDPAPIVDVVERALIEHDPTTVFEAFADLIRSGEIYEAKTDRVRRTSQ